LIAGIYLVLATTLIRARMRVVASTDISLPPRSVLSLRTQSTFQSLAASCRKLGCIFSNTYEIESARARVSQGWSK
jgi:hypothetical protein